VASFSTPTGIITTYLKMRRVPALCFGIAVYLSCPNQHRSIRDALEIEPSFA
jgi:hypothetical protein